MSKKDKKEVKKLVKKSGVDNKTYITYKAKGDINSLIIQILKNNKKKFNKKFLKKMSKLKDNEFLTELVLFHKYHAAEDVEVELGKPKNKIGF